jgi:fumarate reductase iron-sulfur subunit
MSARPNRRFPWRYGAARATAASRPFTVPRREHQTILDVVTEIQREQDATLSYRFACRVGMCGSCAMVVNGRPRWTCRTASAKRSATTGACGSSRCATSPW